MIRIEGVEGTPELRTAHKLAKLFERHWPGINVSEATEDLITIYASRKISGYKVSDLDIVIAAQLSTPRYFICKNDLRDDAGKRLIGSKIRVHSFIAALEVKDHDATRLQLSAGNVDVKYAEGWKSATAQNDAQKYSLRNYLKDLTLMDPWVYRCLMLEGLDKLPKVRGRTMPDAATVANNFTINEFLGAMLAENHVRKLGNEYAMSSAPKQLMSDIQNSALFSKIAPSSLDRKRMDRIASRPAEARDLACFLGEKRIHLRGEGGTGKTVLLAQLAHEAFMSHGKRSLFLTYNRALAADIQRLLAMLDIPNSSESGGVDVRTVMSFTFSWLRTLGLLDQTQNANEDNYHDHCEEALKYIRTGTVSREEIDRKLREEWFQFEYDAILVDEAQDWPQSEADLIAEIYGANTISIADGRSQLVRGQPTNWKSQLQEPPNVIQQSFVECLRMKKNLSIFANSVAERAGLNWEVKPSEHAAGGRIIITTKSLSEANELHETECALAYEAGNQPIDLLYCFPGKQSQIGSELNHSQIESWFTKKGLGIWNGLDPITRQHYPRSVNQHRIVHYESCRGLEGWTTFLIGFDVFWQQKYMQALSDRNGVPALMDPNHWAQTQAWRWAMIPLSRSIDTTIINLTDPNNYASQLLLNVAGNLPDFVELQI